MDVIDLLTEDKLDDATKIALLAEKANIGNVKAMCALARCYLRGEHGVAKNVDEALRWYTTARDGFNLSSVGWACYYGGRDVPNRDVDKAVSAWTMAAGVGYDEAMDRLGWCYQHGVGVECDQPRAVSLYTAATTKLAWQHAWRVGVCYLRGEGAARDWATAAGIFQRSDRLEAQAYLGWCYLWGCGVERDVEKALRLLRRHDTGRASLFLGYCYDWGVGVGRDTDRAQELFNKLQSTTPGRTVRGAEELGELGEYCERGDCGAPTDKRAAVRYYQMGAEGGDPVSMFHLGVCLGDGSGVDFDVEQSHHWLVMAAQLGHRGAAKTLSSSSLSNSTAVQEITVDTLKKRVEALEEQLLEEQRAAEKVRTQLTEEAERYKTIVNTMTSLISATIDDFGVVELLGTGSNAAAFKVQYRTTTFNSNCTTNATSTASQPPSNSNHQTTTRDMVMKVLFNWENTPRQTLLRQKYMAECVALSLVPNHPNVIHPLGAFVIPCLPEEFADKIPREQTVFRELSNNKSFAILMPHCGITLSSFLLSSSSIQNSLERLEVAQNLFVQALKAIIHIESHFLVHRDIKGDNILVDPETGKLTLIDFGEAQNCPNMEMMVTATSQAWGNTGTMPPELSVFLKRITRGTGAVFSYSKCDSFSLALTFWNALLPPDHKFIGHHDMSAFNTQSLLSDFPVPLFSSSSQLLRAAALQTQPTPTTAKRRRQNNSSTSNNEQPVLLESVMIRMMTPDKAARLAAADAIHELSSSH
ncbi:calmodulin-dependent protein kinase [Pelomyxa schiedti]|nr:calmodulin-dependent protein kinase [Pelomyxa schiedti]